MRSKYPFLYLAIPFSLMVDITFNILPNDIPNCYIKNTCFCKRNYFNTILKQFNVFIKMQGGFQRPENHKSKWLYIKRLLFLLNFVCLYI